LRFLVPTPQYVAKSLQEGQIVAFRWPGLIAELEALIAEFGAHIAESPKSRSSTPVSRIVRKALTSGGGAVTASAAPPDRTADNRLHPGR
jgi:hypothetical protein